MLLSFFSGRLMESPSAVRLNRTGPYPSSSTFLIFCGNSLLSAANDLMITFPFSGQARTVAYKSFLVWVKRISCAVALLYAPSLNPCALILRLSLKPWGIALKFLFLHHENILFPND